MKSLDRVRGKFVFRYARPIILILLFVLASFVVVARIDLSSSCQLRSATNNWAFSFPRDHGKHDDFEFEWWYVSGNLHSSDGKEWGYQFVIFRRALVHRLGGQMVFRLPFDGYAGHLVLTNITDRKHKFFQTRIGSFFNLAGADNCQLRVWLRTWRLEQQDRTIFLQARQDDFSISLELSPTKNPVLHGENGFVVKGDDRESASHHYSITALRTIGEFEWEGKMYTVKGHSWLDREFGTGISSTSLQGWDWFSLALGNEVELMISRIRHFSEKTKASDMGTIVFPNGTYHSLKPGDFHVISIDTWKSPQTKACYPMGWELTVPSQDLKLTVLPVMRDHEILAFGSTGVDYWEGPVTISGRMNGDAISGKGYVELVGYVQPIGGMF